MAILENKETGYAVTEDLPGAVIGHGHGRYVEQYARITWVRTAQRVIYWGDLNVDGLQFISDLRAHGISATTIFTDIATLERYRNLTVPGPAPTFGGATLPASRSTSREDSRCNDVK